MEPPEVFDFPFQPYKIQHDFMKNLYSVIENKKLGIFESPTGTGKSLSIICGAIRWLKDHNRHKKELIQTEMNKLEAEREKIPSDDWFNKQVQESSLVTQIRKLKLESEQIAEYEAKIEKLQKKKTDIQKKKHKPELKVDKEKEEDDDIVLEVKSEDEAESEEENDTKYKPTKIFICSRTHSQLSQFIGEILKSPFGKDIRVASLASRQTYCINPNVNKLKSNSLINERCLDKQKKGSVKRDDDGRVVKKQKGDNSKCPFYRQGNIGDLKDLVLTEVQDIEDLLENGKKLNACPYYSTRLAAEDAEIVLVPYNTILHKATREANGIDLKNNVVVIDEAHNLLEAMAQMHNSEVTYTQINQGLILVKAYKNKFHTRFSSANLLQINQLIFVLNKLHQLIEKMNELKTNVFTVGDFVLNAKIDNFNMFKILKFCKDSRLAQKVRSYALKYPVNESDQKPEKNGLKNFLSTIKNKDLVEKSEEKPQQFILSNPLLAIIPFLETLTYSYTDGRIFVYGNPNNVERKLQFLLLNPSQNFQDVVRLARSVIVAGGTMKPNEEFRNRLFINSGASPERIVEFSCDHIISSDNISPIIMTSGPNEEKLLFNYQQRMSMGTHIKRILEDACKTVTGGIVVFFPSYNYENWLWNEIKDFSFGRPVFREPKDSSSIDKVLKSYSSVIQKSKNALLLSVVGGKLSEGLNFSDDLGRCVIVVGLPYANIMAPDLKEKMAFLDKNEGVGAGKKFYENLCMKAVNQSIGRAVRHKYDYATILLIDERYNRNSIKTALPDWIQKSLKVCNYRETFDSVKIFFQNKSFVK